jgi:fructose-1,6-bisphosphatase/sedoheptulose 1,7-bisphosphatase-like protein
MLARTRNEKLASEFEAAGAYVERIHCGDFEAHLRSLGNQVGNSRIEISYGSGGLPEGFLAAPYAHALGGEILLRAAPDAEMHAAILKSKCGEMLGRVYQKRDMMSPKDCVLAMAGITDTSLVPGVRYESQADRTRVSVLTASPALPTRMRCFEFSFATGWEMREMLKPH